MKHIRHFLAWDAWRIHRELPIGYRLRRYVAWNAAGAFASLVAMVAESCVVSGLLGFLLLACLFRLFLHFVSRTRIRRDPPVKLSGRDRLLRTAYWTAVLAPAATLAASDRMGFDCESSLHVALLLFTVFLLPVFVFAYRPLFSPRALSEAAVYRITDEGRIFDGIARPLLLIWALFAVRWTFWPREAPPEPSPLAAEWLLDGDGGLREPFFFAVPDESCLPYSPETVSNLLAAAGNPPPPETRLALELEAADSAGRTISPDFDPLGDNAFFEDAATNIVGGLPDGLAPWMGRQKESLERMSSFPDPQTELFLATNGVGSALRQRCLPFLLPYRSAIRHVRFGLLAAVDSGGTEEVRAALRDAWAWRDAIVRLRGGLVSSLVAMLLDDIVLRGVMRFSQRGDLSAADFRAVGDEIAAHRFESHSRRVLQAIADEEIRVHCLDSRRIWQESGCLLLFGWSPKEFADEKEEEFPSFGPVKRYIGEICMTVCGCNHRRWRAANERMAVRRVEAAAERLATKRADSFARLGLDGESSAKEWAPGLLGEDLWGFATGQSLEEEVFFIGIQAKARYADAYGAVMRAALMLAEFRAANGREAASLKEAAQTLGLEIPETGSPFVLLRHERIVPPESDYVSSESGATLLALLPAFFDAPPWFSGYGNGMGWLTVRNPSFSGTLPFRIYRYDGKGRKVNVPDNVICLLPSVSDVQFLSVTGSGEIASMEDRLETFSWKPCTAFP